MSIAELARFAQHTANAVGKRAAHERNQRLDLRRCGATVHGRELFAVFLFDLGALAKVARQRCRQRRCVFDALQHNAGLVPQLDCKLNAVVHHVCRRRFHSSTTCSFSSYDIHCALLLGALAIVTFHVPCAASCQLTTLVYVQLEMSLDGSP